MDVTEPIDDNPPARKMPKTIPPSVMCTMYQELESYVKSAMSLLELVLDEKYEMKRKHLLKKDVCPSLGERVEDCIVLDAHCQ